MRVLVSLPIGLLVGAAFVTGYSVWKHTKKEEPKIEVDVGFIEMSLELMKKKLEEQKKQMK